MHLSPHPSDVADSLFYHLTWFVGVLCLSFCYYVNITRIATLCPFWFCNNLARKRELVAML